MTGTENDQQTNITHTNSQWYIFENTLEDISTHTSGGKSLKKHWITTVHTHTHSWRLIFKIKLQDDSANIARI